MLYASVLRIYKTINLDVCAFLYFPKLQAVAADLVKK